MKLYLRENRCRIAFAMLLVALAALGLLDASMGTASALVLGNVEPTDFKTMVEAMHKAFAAVRTDRDKLAGRLLELEQKFSHRPSSGFSPGGGDGDEIMRTIEASEHFKNMQRGELKRAAFVVPSHAIRWKAIFSPISGGTIAAPDRSGEFVAPAQRRMTIRDLLPSVPTSAGSTEFVRELLYTNNAGPQGYGSSPAETEGQVKAESDLSFELVNSPVITIAHHFTTSRQALDDSAALGQYIRTRGTYGLALEEEDELLNGAGTGGKLTGLVASAAEFTGGQTNLTPLDVIRRAITQVALNEHVASAVVLNPRDAETIETAKDANLRYLAMVIDGKVWRLPIIATNSMPAGYFLVGDFAMAATIRDRQEATVEISLDHADYRTRNLALVLIEERVGLEIHRPNALVYGSLSYSG